MSGRRTTAVLSLLALLVAPGCDFGDGQRIEHPEAAECGSCHPAHLVMWQESPHAVGMRSPVFQAYVAKAETTWGESVANQCRGCHDPKHSADASVTCVSCHAAVGNRGRGNGALVIDLDAPLAGPFPDPEAGMPHGARPPGFLRSPDLCGSCHEIAAPMPLIEPTWTEFEASPQAQAGATCASCHMPEIEPGPVVAGSDRVRTRHSHRFQSVGPLWSAPKTLGGPEHWERVRALLDTALELKVSATAEGFVVQVANVGAGHAVPTGQATLRDLWVDVEVLGPGGDTVTSLTRVIEIGDRPYLGDVPVALFTDSDHIEHGSLQAGAVTAVSIDEVLVGAPIGAVRATLRFRPLRDAVLVGLGLSELTERLPTLDIDAVSASAAGP